MTFEQLKQKHSIIENILNEDEINITTVIFIFDIPKEFIGTEEERIIAIDEYCTRVESIIKSL